jgi:hypothetical protein
VGRIWKSLEKQARKKLRRLNIELNGEFWWKLRRLEF